MSAPLAEVFASQCPLDGVRVGSAMTRLAGADVGATNSRLRVVEDGATLCKATSMTADHADGAALLAGMLGGVEVDALCVAVAGPVANGAALLTNGELRFDSRELRTALSVPKVLVVNDLVALATEVRHLSDASLLPLGEPQRKPGACAVLAPGTGLGMAMVTPEGQTLPSEGGHAPFAPADPLEQEILRVLAAKLGYVCWEDVLSGPGLQNLYGGLRQVWGAAAEDLTAKDILERGLALADPVCRQTLETYCAILGSAAGSLCVTSCAEGGLYLGGGLPPRLADLLPNSAFRRRFEDRGRMSAYVEGVATVLIKDDAAGLAGALRLAGELGKAQLA